MYFIGISRDRMLIVEDSSSTNVQHHRLATIKDVDIESHLHCHTPSTPPVRPVESHTMAGGAYRITSIDPRYTKLYVKTNRRIYLQNLINLLHASLHKRDAVRAYRSWAILVSRVDVQAEARKLCRSALRCDDPSISVRSIAIPSPRPPGFPPTSITPMEMISPRSVTKH
jgi:hypothetical protein